jgi:hypothetical protein
MKTNPNDINNDAQALLAALKKAGVDLNLARLESCGVPWLPAAVIY